MQLIFTLAAAFLATTSVSAAPAPASSSSPTSTFGNTAVLPHQTVEPAPEFANPPLFDQFENNPEPEAIRGDGGGATILGKLNHF